MTALYGTITQTAETVVYVEDGIAGLSATNDGPTPIGDPTTLTASITAGENVSYTWNFGDGATGSGQQIMHIYSEPGEYTAVVTATNTVSIQTVTTTVTVIETEFLIFMPAVAKPQ